MNSINVIFSFMLLVVSGCASTNVPKEVSQQHCVDHSSPKACQKLFSSKFNSIESGYVHPDAKVTRVPRAQGYTAYWVSIDKSSYAKFELPDCKPKNQNGGWFSRKPKITDFENCIVGQKDGVDLNFQSVGNNSSPAYRDRVRKTFRTQSKNMFVSSIVYDGPKRSIDFSLTNNDCSNVRDLPKGNSSIFIECSFQALNEFEERLEHRLSKENYTHLILLSTGWNTVPSSSIENYNTLINSMRISEFRDEQFKPLVIGLTWPSKWRNIRVSSYGTKANDADEIGMIWGNYLVNNTIPNAIRKSSLSKPKTLVVGHSFGARILSTALVSGNYLETSNQLQIKPDALILLQSAFSANRFHEDENKGHGKFLEGLQSKTELVALTSSEGDSTVNLALHVDNGRGHISSDEAWGNICFPQTISDGESKWRDKFECVVEDKISTYSPSGANKIIYVKMNDIKHGDVWGEEAAKVIWSVLR